MFERFIYTINNCEPIKSRTFLDIGSGTGLFSIELAKKGAGKVIGIDIAEKMVTISNKEAEVLGLQQVCNFIQSDLLDYKADTDIDVSFGIGLFDYIKNPLPVLTKMQEISKDKAILSFPRFWTWRMPIRKVRLTLKGCSVYFYTKKRVKNLLNDAGFKDLKIDKIGKLFCVVAYNN
jgi:cyclopropane fatty-acyl-phospholipid synthase-like methyltransferase